MKTVKKSEFLEAAKYILGEYQMKIHSALVTSCQLCKLYYNHKINNFHTCTCCPMYVFKGIESYSCMSRKCKPINCYYIMSKSNMTLRRVIKFYKVVIKATKEIPDAEFNVKLLRKELKRIDKEVFESVKS
jgi:hypothetical protein